VGAGEETSGFLVLVRVVVVVVVALGRPHRQIVVRGRRDDGDHRDRPGRGSAGLGGAVLNLGQAEALAVLLLLLLLLLATGKIEDHDDPAGFHGDSEQDKNACRNSRENPAGNQSAEIDFGRSSGRRRDRQFCGRWVAVVVVVVVAAGGGGGGGGGADGSGGGAALLISLAAGCLQEHPLQDLEVGLPVNVQSKCLFTSVEVFYKYSELHL